MKNSIELSIIIPVTERSDEIVELFRDYKRGIETIGMRYEIIYVLDGDFPDISNALKQLIDNGENISVITLAKWFGEAVALNVGFKYSSGNIILTLPAYRQISSEDFPQLIQALDDCDMVLARRWPRRDSWFNRLQANIFNFILGKVSDLRLHDAGCKVRAFKRSIIDEVYIYGDLYRFLPIMAFRQGFKIKELKVSQSSYDIFRRVYPLGLYVRVLLDLLNIFFLIKFTKKPLRFFGLLGLSTFAVGLLATLYIAPEVIIKTVCGKDAAVERIGTY